MEIVFRAVVVYLFLLAMTRALGKRELTEMTAFELLLLIVLGDIVQQGVTQEDMSITGAVLAAGTMGLLVLATSYIGFRFRPARRITEGVAVVVIRNGRIQHEALKIERITDEELAAEARLRGIRDLGEVELGILEPDGKFSFLQLNGGDNSRGDEATHKT